jgi:DNA-binding transcriptional MerR regulator
VEADVSSTRGSAARLGTGVHTGDKEHGIEVTGNPIMDAEHVVLQKEERMARFDGDSSGVLPEGRLQPGDAAVTAVELARLAGVAPKDIHYWGKSEYLEKRRNGSSSFPLSQVPKAQLMGIFAKQLHMDAATASKLAEQLLPLYATKPDVVAALKTLAAVVDSRIDALARVLMETDFAPMLQKLLEPKPPEKEK